MTVKNTVQNFDIVKFMSDFDMQVINKSITKHEAAILYESLLRSNLINIKEPQTALSFSDSYYIVFNKDHVNNLKNKLVKIMESQ